MTASTLELTPQILAGIPSHVPADRVSNFSIHEDPNMAKCPFTAATRAHAGPDVVWSPFSRRASGPDGSWVVTRAEDMRTVLGHPDRFSSKGISGFSQLIGDSWDMLPLEIDPPMHTKFRTILNPILYPRVVSSMVAGVVARANELLDRIVEQGHCEFMSAFGRPFPVSIFMQLMGLPAEQMPTFLAWEAGLLHGKDMETRRAAAVEIRDYLRTLAEESRAAPRDDLASLVVTVTVDDRPWTDDEVMGALYLFFVGGLDTVASSLGWFFHYLATHPDQQQWLRENPAEIPHAVEELVRRFSVVVTNRRCVADTELGGVTIKAGDWVTVPFALGSLDPREFDDPMTVDFQRKGVRHFGFAFGPHFCIGSHLARREMAVALAEWLRRVPQWRLKPGAPVIQHGGGVFGIEHLELEW